MDRATYEARVRAAQYQRTDSRDLFTSRGNRVSYADLELAANYGFRSAPEAKDLARRALSGDRLAVDQFSELLARREQSRDDLANLTGFVVAGLGVAGLVYAGKRILTQKREDRRIPRARSLP